MGVELKVPRKVKLLDGKAIRDALLALPDSERALVITNPESGQHKIIGIRRNNNDLVEYDYEGVPE